MAMFDTMSGPLSTCNTCASSGGRRCVVVLTGVAYEDEAK